VVNAQTDEDFSFDVIFADVVYNNGDTCDWTISNGATIDEVSFPADNSIHVIILDVPIVPGETYFTVPENSTFNVIVGDDTMPLCAGNYIIYGD
jgi:3D (Asp-Asp-Asp) domain-containing protein